MTTIEEIMTKDVLAVNPDAQISIAVKIFVIRKITGLPVIDANRNLLGIITEKDLMHLLIKNEKNEEKIVADFMTKDVKYFAPEDNVIDVCTVLLENPFRTIPIVNDGKLVGIVSRSDMIKLLWEEIQNKQNMYTQT
ncbi:MAG: hypothetical protein DRP78_03390 [Candidatus Omnitrophota bacterium]|nr:MAG: hypothetical protein DRP78_03390 [Candidatus Omnitrophota bacterium]